MSFTDLRTVDWITVQRLIGGEAGGAAQPLRAICAAGSLLRLRCAHHNRRLWRGHDNGKKCVKELDRHACAAANIACDWRPPAALLHDQ